MKAKKIISALLAITMLLSMMGLIAFAEGEAVASVNGTPYSTLAEALAAVGAGDVTITLAADAELSYGAREAYGTSETTSITIEGNNKTLTLNQTDSDWSSIGMANANGVFKMNYVNVVKTGYGVPGGAWNTHAINFNVNTELTNVDFDNSIKVSGTSVLTNVNIVEDEEFYGIWIPADATSVTINGGSIKATNGGRGIKIADQYVEDSAQKVSLKVDGMTFETAKKAAVLVSSTGGANITATNCDISKVAADSTNFAWVDEEWALSANEVTVNGGSAFIEGTVAPILSGKGTEAEPYLINNIDDLEAFRDDVNAGNTYKGEYVLLTADIDFEGYEEMNIGGILSSTFRPIGDSGFNASFNGIFDGGERTISNLYQSGWDLGYEWGSYGSLGLFGVINDATIKNLTVSGFELQVEGGDVAAIAGSATGTCMFENITVSDSNIATYNNGCGSIIAWSGAGSYTFKDITIDEGVVLTGLWGSFDSSIGGVVGQAEPGATYNFENVDIACQLNIFNDVTASYDYYNYRMCGMIIGRMEETKTVDGEAYPDMDKYTVICKDVNVTIGEWANYTYCDPTPGLNNGRGMRVEAGYSYDGLPADYDHSTCTVHCREIMHFDTLFGGRQYGVDGNGVDDLIKLGYIDLASNITVDDQAKTARSRVQIGENTYPTLKEAVAAATPGDEITLLANINENVTIDKSLTLSGADFDYTGTMTISKSINLTIDDVNFINGNIVKGKSTGTSGTYTIKNCSFDSDSNSVYAIEIRGSGSIIIENCTSEGYYGFLQVPSSNNSISIKDVTIKETGYAIKVDYSNGVSLENVTIEDSTYGFVNSNFGTKTIAVKNCTIKADYPLVIWDRDTKKINTFKFVGANDFGSNNLYWNKVTEDEKAYTKFILTDTDTTWTAVEGLNVTTSLEGATVAYDNGTYIVPYIAQVGENKYTNLQEAVNVGGEITLLANVTENITIADNANIVLDLNGKTLTGYIAPCKPASLTVKNGTIVNKDSSVSAIEVNAGTLEVENVNIDSERHAIRIDGPVTANINGGVYKVLVNNNVSAHTINVSGAAVVTIKDGTFYGPKGTPNGSAMGGSALQSRDTAVVTIEGGNFSGGVNKTINGAAVSNVSVKGGTFDQDPTSYLVDGMQAVRDDLTGLYTVVGTWTVSATTETEECYADDTVTVTVKADGANYAGATWTLTYDPAKFEYQGTTSTPGTIEGYIYDETTKDAFDKDTALATYTFKALAQTEIVTGAFEITEATVGTVAMSVNSLPEANKAAADEVTILLKDFTVTVYDNETVITGTDYNIPYDDKEHTISVKTNPGANVHYTYAVDGGEASAESTTAPVIKNPGTYTITYRVDVPAGYDQTTTTAQTITVTIGATIPEIEVTEYVSGYKLVLVYTDVDNAHFRYDDSAALMLDVTAAGYKYKNDVGNVSEHSYKYVYGYVVPSIMVNDSTYADNDAYRNKVKFELGGNVTVINPYDYNVNCSADNVVDLADVIYTRSVYNTIETNMVEDYMKRILKADVTKSKEVDNNDVTDVKSAWENN